MRFAIVASLLLAVAMSTLPTIVSIDQRHLDTSRASCVANAVHVAAKHGLHYLKETTGVKDACRNGGGMQCGSMIDDGPKAATFARHVTTAAAGRATTTVCETGVYYGQSAFNWLCSHPSVQLVAFDLFIDPKVQATLRRAFPGRVTLTNGSSLHTVPTFAAAHPGVRCDIISVDGGHFGYVPLHDLRNFHAMAARRAVVILDEVGFLLGGSRGVKHDMLGHPIGGPAGEEAKERLCCPDNTVQPTDGARTLHAAPVIACGCSVSHSAPSRLSPALQLAWLAATSWGLLERGTARCFEPRKDGTISAAHGRGWCEGRYAESVDQSAWAEAVLGSPRASNLAAEAAALQRLPAPRP